MSGEKKPSLCKPPVPIRPKNLVLDSRHLPKPPETFSVGSATDFIKDLNLDVKDEENLARKISKGRNCDNSDGEEESFGYLEPVSLQPLNLRYLNERVNGQTQFKKLQSEDSAKLGDLFWKIINRNTSGCSEVPEFEETKPGYQRQRPLPSLPLPPVETKSVVATMPWYKNVDRRGGEEILRNGVNGYFLVRPSSQADAYLTLTLWYSNRVYNIPIRRRKDGKFALGTPKTHEQCFDSVEYLVKNYQSEKLVLYSNGAPTGKTLLTTFPP